MTVFSIGIAALSVLLFAWVIVGYPLLLARLARRERPIRKSWQAQRISIIVAVRDGEHYIRAKIESLLNLDYPKDLLDITVASDGSTDSTDDIVRGFASKGVRLIRGRRLGKAAALNKAIPTTSGDILILTDVRQKLERGCAKELISCFSDPNVGAVSGTLRILDGATQQQADVGAYWRYETWIRNNLSRLDSIFGATGPMYAIRRHLVVPVPNDILLDDMYLPLAGFFQGYRLIVDDKAVAYDYATSLDVEFRRKVRTLGGNYQILKHYPGLMGPGNRMWFHYMSYKFGRLLLPFALLAFGAASVFLPDPWSAIAIDGQAILYGLAAVDFMVPERFPLKRLSSMCRTFVVMMAAALCATSVFFIPPNRLWKVTSSIKLGSVRESEQPLPVAADALSQQER